MRLLLFVFICIVGLFVYANDTTAAQESLSLDPETAFESQLNETLKKAQGYQQGVQQELQVEAPLNALKVEPSPSPNLSAPLASKSETEIPVQLEETKKKNSEESSVFKMMISMALIGMIAFCSYLFIKKNNQSKKGSKTSPQIKVISQQFLGPKKYLAIVRVAGESILIGVTDNQINLIKSLSLLDEDIPEETPNSFSKVIDNLNRRPPVEAKKEVTRPFFSDESFEADSDDFSIAGIKDVVSKKLKNMRALG